MITLLHGDNIEASRLELTGMMTKNIGKEIRILDGKHLDETALIQAMESNSLFGSNVIVLIENLFTPLGRKTKRIKEIVQLLDTTTQTIDCICWEPKELSKETQSFFTSKIVSRLFSIPKTIFIFLDAIKMNNSKTLLLLAEDLFTTSAPELVWSMMVSRVRQLIQIQSGVAPAKLQSWQVSRLTNQSRSFTMDKLLKSYSNMLDLEYKLKTGLLPFTMTEIIKQWIIEL